MDLRLKLDNTDFEQLTTSAQALIPTLAPEWTDHNVHDPGIMLVELMAWVAEAQIYSLSRLRIDERLAYARLLGLKQSGPKSAQGLIWPLEADEPGYRAGTILGQSVDKGTAVAADNAEMPPFRLCLGQHLTPAVLRRVVTHFADGRTADNTRVNNRNGSTFLPFGAAPLPGDRLELSFDGYAVAPGGRGGFVLGVEVDRTAAELPPLPDSGRPSVSVSIRDRSGERPVAVSRDTTAGLRRSGVLVLDIAESEQTRQPDAKDRWFDLILRPTAAGFLRVPRLRRIAANALWVEQIESIDDEETYFGKALPAQTYRLSRTGRVLDRELAVEVAGEKWTRMEDISRSEPDAPHYQFDEARREILFGNGLDGRMPPLAATLSVRYDVCSGARGNAPAGIGWSLRGVSGTFGRNSQPFAGASDAIELGDLQRAARQSLARNVTYVTANDLEHAALALGDLHVARALELPALAGQLRGVRTLLVVAGPGPDAVPETAQWLEAVRARLASRLPAGQRLDVVGPRRVGLRIRARLVVPSAADVTRTRTQAQEMLRSKFIGPDGEPIWKFGRDLTVLTVRGWLRKLEHVLSVGETTLYRDGVAQPDKVAMSPIELPRLDMSDADIAVERKAVGGRP